MAAVNDWYGYPSLSRQGILSGDLSMYAIGRDNLMNLNVTYGTDGRPEQEYMFVPQTSEVISCYFFPYLDYSHIVQVEVDYDEETFPLCANAEQQKSYTMNRVIGFGDDGIVDVGEFSKYPVSGTSIGGVYNWRNEGKLWLPPFTQIVCSDGFSEPFGVNPLLINDNNSTFKICCRQSLNHLGLYTLYIDGYKGLSQGKLFGSTTGGNSLPVISSSYTDYMNQNRYNLKNERMKTIVGGLTNLFTGNLMGVGQSLFDYGDSYQGEINAMNSGYSLTSSGSDSILDLSFVTGMTAYYQQPLEEYMERLGHYFHLYGYAQNKMMTPSISNRKYWNYVKTSDVHLKVNNCPKEHLQTLKAIFDNGVTVWNMANGNLFENLNKDNVEI